MHNLHIITIVHDKDDLEGAAESALIEIEDFGNENNWREWSSVISESDEYIINDRCLWLDKDLLKSSGIGCVDYVKSFIYNTLITPTSSYEQGFNRIKQSDNILNENYMTLWEASRYLRELSEFVQITDDIWNLNYMPGHYDEPGVTCMIDPNHNHNHNKLIEERYIVFIDMHS